MNINNPYGWDVGRHLNLPIQYYTVNYVFLNRTKLPNYKRYLKNNSKRFTNCSQLEHRQKIDFLI